ncbi:MAG: hypothetical protein JW832_01585 [Deltaproteobacteria bacterium]|nr:hypothetical protein [Deltaproteobacteria bacterium]
MNLHGIKTAIATLMLCLLCACSNTRLAYNYLDWIVTWNLNDYLNLNSRQAAFYKQRLHVLLQWHRTDQLIRYSRFIEQLQQDMHGPLNVEMLRQRSDSLKQFWNDIMIRSAPDCAGVLLLLDRDQRQAFYAALAKKQKQLEEKHLNETPARRKARHFEQAEKPLKRLLGRLTEAQKAVLNHWAEDLIPLQNLWLDNRRIWQKSMQDVLEGSNAEAEKCKLLERLFIEPEYLWKPAYRQAIKQNEASTFAMLAKLLGNLTEKQKQHAHVFLENLKKDFITLSKE